MARRLVPYLLPYLSDVQPIDVAQLEARFNALSERFTHFELVTNDQLGRVNERLVGLELLVERLTERVMGIELAVAAVQEDDRRVLAALTDVTNRLAIVEDALSKAIIRVLPPFYINQGVLGLMKTDDFLVDDLGRLSVPSLAVIRGRLNVAYDNADWCRQAIVARLPEIYDLPLLLRVVGGVLHLTSGFDVSAFSLTPDGRLSLKHDLLVAIQTLTILASDVIPRTYRSPLLLSGSPGARVLSLEHSTNLPVVASKLDLDPELLARINTMGKVKSFSNAFSLSPDGVLTVKTIAPLIVDVEGMSLLFGRGLELQKGVLIPSEPLLEPPLVLKYPPLVVPDDPCLSDFDVCDAPPQVDYTGRPTISLRMDPSGVSLTKLKSLTLSRVSSGAWAVAVTLAVKDTAGNVAEMITPLTPGLRFIDGLGFIAATLCVSFTLPKPQAIASIYVGITNTGAVGTGRWRDLSHDQLLKAVWPPTPGVSVPVSTMVHGNTKDGAPVSLVGMDLISGSFGAPYMFTIEYLTIQSPLRPIIKGAMFATACWPTM
uniref:Fiber protein n=1 Tax=Chinook aquareovirus TaxID=2587490 RepID=A0A5B9N430_9REOV|nr:MAG: fiber protein [Chinook aquareovirus]